jgi:hypothetical protein
MELLNNVIAAGISAVVTVSAIHPIDVVKTRLQISDSSVKNYKALGINGTIKTIYKDEGARAFWKGIQAAWIREATYTSLRLGLYSPINKLIDPNNKYGFAGKFTSGSIAGAIGSIVGNPFDVVKTKLMATEQKNSISFRNIFNSIYLTEGIDGFYKGLSANVMRACILNGTKMACYDQIKEVIVSKGFDKKSISTQFLSAFGAGFFMAITVTPFDMIRTQLMNQSPTNKYNGFVDCTQKILKTRGFSGLYAGFVPIWMRFAPTTTFQLVIFEQIKPFFGLK